jgi:hypothetical protein
MHSQKNIKLCNLTKYRYKIPWRWHTDVETSRNVYHIKRQMVWYIIVHLLVVVRTISLHLRLGKFVAKPIPDWHMFDIYVVRYFYCWLYNELPFPSKEKTENMSCNATYQKLSIYERNPKRRCDDFRRRFEICATSCDDARLADQRLQYYRWADQRVQFYRWADQRVQYYRSCYPSIISDVFDSSFENIIMLTNATTWQM